MLARVSSTPTFKRLPRAVREQQMLDAAVKVFSRRGFHAASMDEIAEDAGISKPMVYAYLGTKEELFVACLHREGTRMMEAIAGAAAPDLPADERLWRGLRAFFGFVGAHRDGWAVLYRQARGEQPFAGELATMRGPAGRGGRRNARPRAARRGPRGRPRPTWRSSRTPWSARPSRWRTGSPTTPRPTRRRPPPG